MNKLLIYFMLFLIASTNVNAKVYPFVTNNSFKLLHDPYESKDLKLQLVKEAKHHIHIMTYFWDKSEFPTELAHALNDAHQRGVEVRIISTLFPSVVTDIFQKAKKHLKLKEKNPNTPFVYLPLGFHKDLTRTNNIHEKVFIVDGEIAITGGRNIADSALRGKDLEVLMKGEIVHQVQDHFKIMFDFIIKLKNQEICSKDTEIGITNVEECLNKNPYSFNNSDQNFFPKFVENIGQTKARILSHEAIIKQFENHYTIKERLNMPDDILDTVTSAEFQEMRGYNYFILPTERYKTFLSKNVEAGKSIKLITNSLQSATFSSNKGYLLGIPFMRSLIKNGVEIFQWNQNPYKNGKNTYVHSKVITFDDFRTIIGSHNFGFGSTMASNELAVDIYSIEITKELNHIFDQEISSKEITKKTNLELLNKEEMSNSFLIKLLNKDFINDLIKELY